MADHLLLLRFKAGSCVAADVIPPDISPSFDMLPYDRTVPDVVRLMDFLPRMCRTHH